MKFAAYLHSIIAGLARGECAESDVIVLMDAFDVLVFPALRNIKQVHMCLHTCIISDMTCVWSAGNGTTAV